MKALAGLLVSFSIMFVVHAAPNPAAIYAFSLGYDYAVIDTPHGAQGVVMVAPGVQFDEWDFFVGKVGQAYAYGERHGYETQHVREDRGGYIVEYSLCVPTEKSASEGMEPIETVALMKQNGDWLDTADRRISKHASDMVFDAPAPIVPKNLPTSFDWRNHDGRAYIGPVKNQGACGSCYAFGAAAAAEGTYNLANNLYDGAGIRFSESFIAWCLGGLPHYNQHFYGCEGADYEYMELTALCVDGVCREADYPYTTQEPSSCQHWDAPRVQFSSWGRAGCGDIEGIKAIIRTRGVVDAAVLTTMDFNLYQGGIYGDGNVNCPAQPCYYTQVDHAIALVGWNDSPPDNGEGYWILRNSWGTGWGEAGYMRIRYSSAAVTCAVAYLVYDAPPSEEGEGENVGEGEGEDVVEGEVEGESIGEGEEEVEGEGEGEQEGESVIEITEGELNVLVAVPDVTNMREQTARSHLTRKGFVIHRVSAEYSDLLERDLVISQTPLPGVEVAYGTRVNLTVSRGPEFPVVDPEGEGENDPVIPGEGEDPAVDEGEDGEGETEGEGEGEGEGDDSGSGCSFSCDGAQKRLADWLLVGVTLLTLLALSRRRM